ncbi:MAG: hypothetical protein R3348_10010, partial [Xanthomonadales bacterium]|nr:hypothetical protein [Xanthomonadales bacterium]
SSDPLFQAQRSESLAAALAKPSFGSRASLKASADEMAATLRELDASRQLVSEAAEYCRSQGQPPGPPDIAAQWLQAYRAAIALKAEPEMAGEKHAR